MHTCLRSTVSDDMWYPDHMPRCAVQAIEEALTPRLSVTGEMGTLAKFKQFFEGKSLEKGSDILLLWKKEGVLEIVAKPRPSSGDYSQVQLASVRVHSVTCFVCKSILSSSQDLFVTQTALNNAETFSRNMWVMIGHDTWLLQLVASHNW